MTATVGLLSHDMTETFFTLLSIAFFTSMFWSLERLARTYDEDVVKRMRKLKHLEELA